MTGHAEPVGGKILTGPFKLLLALAAVTVPLLAWRFLSGIGATTALNDGYPWGIWIAYDVVSGTALACGGYAMALIVYILNNGKYHPLVRPAILTSALGYSLATFAIVLDVGRYWNLWKVPLLWNWNRNSILLEVALCVMTYVVVLWIELSPAFMEKWQEEGTFPLLSGLSRKVYPLLDKVMIWIIALGILLPTMHHSSLGGLFLISVTKLHKLWHTPMLPLLFLVSCLVMGYAVVVFESTLSAVTFRRPRETKMIASLGKVLAAVLFIYLALRVGDVALRGRLGLVSAFDLYAFLFLLEVALFATPMVLLLSKTRRENPGIQFLCAMLMILAGTLYRFDVYMIAFNPGPGWSYFPSIPEMFITFGLVAMEIMAYVVIVKRYPIISGASPAASGGF